MQTYLKIPRTIFFSVLAACIYWHKCISRWNFFDKVWSFGCEIITFQIWPYTKTRIIGGKVFKDVNHVEIWWIWLYTSVFLQFILRTGNYVEKKVTKIQTKSGNKPHCYDNNKQEAKHNVSDVTEEIVERLDT